jgi:hypothetical protein
MCACRSNADAYDVAVLALDVELADCAADTVDESNVGKSSTSDTLSIFLESSIALFRLSSTAFSVLLSYLVAKLVAADSNSGMPSYSSSVCDSRDGRIDVRFER